MGSQQNSPKLSKAEKRIARQEAKAAKRKKPPAITSPPSGKLVPESSSSAPAGIDTQLFQWSATEVDHDYAGDWDWDLSPAETSELLSLLEASSKHTWRELKDLKFNSNSRTRALHHDQPTGSVCRAAQVRLDELRIDTPKLFRLRHGNLVRVWGYLAGPVFRIIWYDRSHKVCPVES